MEFVRNMERRRLIKPQDILATLQSIPEDETESELQEHVFDSDSDEDFIPQNISSESEDSEGTNPEDIPSTSTGDRAHAVMLPRDHPPGRGQKKSAKRPRNERTTDNDGGEGNATTNTREGESEGILVSADGIQWKPVEIGEHLPGRRDSQNILREAPGPTGYARRNIIIDSPLSAWRLFFDSYILTHIKNCTLAEACRNNNLQFTLSDEELDAFIAIFYDRGISGTNRHSISSIWCNDWGIPFCKATMSRDRFVEIMRFLRFDEKSTRSERLQTDKFALFSTVWDRFIENCIACYKPGPYITVDEQLFPSKTRCPFTQYMPSKPDKYGHKYWLAVDKRSKYLANGFPYLGKDDTRRAEDHLADHVVMKLLDPFLKKGRNVTTDNYFTSVKLAKQLKSKGTTIVGTLNKIRREVPKEIKSMKEELFKNFKDLFLLWSRERGCMGAVNISVARIVCLHTIADPEGTKHCVSQILKALATGMEAETTLQENRDLEEDFNPSKISESLLLSKDNNSLALAWKAGACVDQPKKNPSSKVNIKIKEDPPVFSHGYCEWKSDCSSVAISVPFYGIFECSQISSNFSMDRGLKMGWLPHTKDNVRFKRFQSSKKGTALKTEALDPVGDVQEDAAAAPPGARNNPKKRSKSGATSIGIEGAEKLNGEKATSATFLDLKISIHGERILTDLYRKPTATNNLLSFSSFHPFHTRQGVPVGQFLRARRKCIQNEDFCHQAKDLTHCFRTRGFPKKDDLQSLSTSQNSDTGDPPYSQE
ncbi:uncharacterized protein [Phyllobates terribilis]|uniref:uncharacterized protein n=1 Tax=Phyllobates terribilis TaxID=111132 RepID=UPI003CCA9925